MRNTAFPGVAVVRGWPSDDDLNAAAAANGAIVAVTQRPGGFSRSTTRYLASETQIDGPPPSLTVSVSGTTATFAGTCSTDQIAGIRTASGEWAIRCLANDTPTTVASSLAARSGGVASGAAVTAAGLSFAATLRDAGNLTFTRQQAVQFSVMIWTADPVKRDQIAGAIDAALSGVEFLSLADGSAGRMTWAETSSTDKARGETLYRRDLNYLVDFPTTIASSDPRVLFFDQTLNGVAYTAH